eukprot:4206732-Pleurochrysis_carterae.AAC.2
MRACPRASPRASPPSAARAVAACARIAAARARTRHCTVSAAAIVDDKFGTCYKSFSDQLN